MAGSVRSLAAVGVLTLVAQRNRPHHRLEGASSDPYLAGYMANVFGTLKYSYVLAAGVFCVGTVLSAFVRDQRVCSPGE